MAKFKNKPVEIDAWQWLFNNKQEPEPVWINDAMHNWPDMGCIAFEPDHADGPRICLATVEGVKIVLPGEWFIKGVQGEILSLPPSMFAEAYEAVE